MTIKEFNIDLKQIKSFMEVVNERSFTAASINLKMSQASISHQMGQLEKMLGVRLINRSSQEFSLTGEGDIFLRFAESILRDVDSLKSELKTGTFGGTARIIASSIPGTYIVPGLISKIMKSFAGYRYKLEIGNSREAIEKIKQGDADIAIVGREIKHPALIFKEIFRDEIILISRPDFDERIEVEDITKIPIIAREIGSGTRNVTENILGKFGIHPSDLDIVMECSTSESVREAVLNGLGLAFISEMAVSKDIALKNLKKVNINGLKMERSFYFVTSTARELSGPAKYFADHIADLAQV